MVCQEKRQIGTESRGFWSGLMRLYHQTKPISRCSSYFQLAEFGFYYEGKAGNPKKVTCHYCDNSLEDIATDVDPIELHAEGSPDCPRVLLRIQHAKWIATKGAENKEYGANEEKILQARLATFAKGWPHEGPEWKCTPEQVRLLQLSPESFSFTNRSCCLLATARSRWIYFCS